MKTNYSLIIVMSISFLVCNPAYPVATPKTVTAIHLKVGQTHRLELKSNPTTGYSWYPTKKIEKNPIIQLVKSGYEADKAHLVGSGGTQYWEIKGKKAGNYNLTLQYKRPWEKKTKAAEVKKFVITVE